MMTLAMEEQRDDYDLMRAVAARDQGALRELYDRHSGLIYSLCLRALRNSAEAEDLLVDVFWELWEKSSRYEAGRGSPVTYLVTLARSRAIDRLRSRAGSAARMKLADVNDVSPPTAGAADNPLVRAID